MGGIFCRAPAGEGGGSYGRDEEVSRDLSQDMPERTKNIQHDFRSLTKPSPNTVLSRHLRQIIDPGLGSGASNITVKCAARPRFNALNNGTGIKDRLRRLSLTCAILTHQSCCRVLCNVYTGTLYSLRWGFKGQHYYTEELTPRYLIYLEVRIFDFLASTSA